jgi:hypothetical protein
MTLLFRTTDEQRIGTPTPASKTLTRARLMRIALYLLVGLLGVLVVSQLLLPRYVEGRIEKRLTRNGGVADVTVKALPAFRLLAGHGDRLTIRGSDLGLDLEGGEPRLWKRLDRFDAVDIRLRDIRTGPFRTQAFALTRPEHADAYRVSLRSEVSIAELAQYAASRILPGGLGGALAGLSAGALPGSRQPVPIVTDMRIVSDDGRPEVVSGGGTVAGLPVALAVEIIGSAVAKRL